MQVKPLRLLRTIRLSPFLSTLAAVRRFASIAPIHKQISREPGICASAGCREHRVHRETRTQNMGVAPSTRVSRPGNSRSNQPPVTRNQQLSNRVSSAAQAMLDHRRQRRGSESGCRVARCRTRIAWTDPAPSRVPTPSPCSAATAARTSAYCATIVRAA